MFKTILLPIDLNHPASWEKALPMAGNLAGTDGVVHVLGIVHDVGSPLVAQALPKGYEEKSLQLMKEALDKFAANNSAAVSNPLTVHVGHGHIPETILSTSTSIDADLIIMESHPAGDLRTLLVGSNTNKVVRHASVPVLAVK